MAAAKELKAAPPAAEVKRADSESALRLSRLRLPGRGRASVTAAKSTSAIGKPIRMTSAAITPNDIRFEGVSIRRAGFGVCTIGRPTSRLRRWER